MQEIAVPTEPFWQLQGAGPSSAGETEAIVQFRNAARAAATPETVVASR